MSCLFINKVIFIFMETKNLFCKLSSSSIYVLSHKHQLYFFFCTSVVVPQKIITSRHNGNIITSAQSLSSPCNVKRYFELLRNLEALAKYAVSRQPLSDLLAWTTKQERGLRISLGPYLLLLSFIFFFSSSYLLKANTNTSLTLDTF